MQAHGLSVQAALDEAAQMYHMEIEEFLEVECIRWCNPASGAGVIRHPPLV